MNEMNNGKSIEQICDEKWATIMFRIKSLKPFYLAVFSTLPRLKFNGTDMHTELNAATVCITSKALVYNEKEVAEIGIDKMLFFCLHEITHYALFHLDRQNRAKHPLVYSMAADLYVNKLLQKEYRLRLGIPTKENGIKILMPVDEILYDDTLDIDNLTVEDIYARLLQFGMKQSNSSQSTVEVGSQGNTIPDEENIVKKMMDSGFENLSASEKQLLSQIMDLIGKVAQDSEGNVTGFSIGGLSETEKNEALSNIRTRIIQSMTEAKLAGSSGGSLLEELVNKVIAPKLDWRRMVRKFLVQITSKETSYLQADRRTLWYDAILPGQASSDNFKLENVKLCTDTSGSITHEDLEVFYAQLGQLCSEFKVDGELIHWDCEMQVMGKINEPKELYKIGQVYGRGGTNPSCLFRYFDSRQCRQKPALIVILTDGYINFDDNPTWAKKYGRKTIWVINKNGDRNFEPPFGKVTNLAQD